MANYKAFFRWLYVVILRLMDEQIPPEIPKMTQQDLMYITEFLQNFDSLPVKDEIPTKGQKNKFNLERLGQYLVDAPLTILPNKENNVWSKFLEENDCIAEHGLVIKPEDESSLLTQKKYLVEAVHKIFLEPKNIISRTFTYKTHIKLCTYVKNVRLSQVNINHDITLTTYLDQNVPANGVYLLETNSTNIIKHLYLYASQFSDYTDSNIANKFIDVQFYTTTHLSVLLSDTSEQNCAFICQIPLALLRSLMSETVLESDKSVIENINARVDICKLSGVTMKTIEGMAVACFAVSGSRHVSVVLSDNKHKVQLFEMEADEEEEDDETEMTVNNTHDSEVMLEESVVSDE